MEKILITGFDGFLGRHLVNYLISKYDVIGLSKRFNKKIKLKQIKKDIQKVTSNDFKNISCIIHFTAITDPKVCEANPNECFNTNVSGTQKILEAARRNNCRVIYASTSHVYGVPNKLPINENHPTNPISIYSGSKLGGEILCAAYARQFDMDISVLRIFSLYGPGSGFHYVLSNIFYQLKTSDVIKLGNIRSKRDFIFISDVVQAFDIILKNLSGFNVYNVGAGNSYSIREICTMIEKLTKRKLMIKTNPVQFTKLDPPNIVCDCTKLKKLGWEPEISIIQGLKLSLEYNKIKF